MKKIKISVLLLFFFTSSVFAKETGGLLTGKYLTGNHPEELEIHFLDVGEGDAIFLQSEKENALIDAGNLITGYKVAEYLKEQKVKKIDHLIVTHPHPDHFGGVFFILQMFDVDKVYDNGQKFHPEDMLDFYRWYEELFRQRENYMVLKAGDILTIGDWNLEVIWPPEPPEYFPDFNISSLAIKVYPVRKGGEISNGVKAATTTVNDSFSCLLAGDIIMPAENELLRRGIDLKSEVLKVGHHGSAEATSDEFLQTVSPEIAIISVNKDNIRGYPAKETIEKLEKANIRIYRTDINGNIVLRKDKKGLTILTEK